MTTVLPPRPATSQEHLVAWVAGYLAAAETLERDAYHTGYQQAIHDICTRVVELELINRATWDTAKAQAKQRIARRRADVEAAAQDMYTREGRHEYRGGPVAWEPEQPATHPRGVR